ncbi:MAG TPA: integrase, partial [Lachnospiraceae bacterium]|nr:integrase [Lachnospiraceae bacterium]
MVHRFLMVFLTEEKKCSPNTVRSYRKALELLFDYVKEQRGVSLGKVTFDMIDRELMADFLNYLEQNRGCSTVTRNHRLECIRAFYKYAAQEDIALVTYYDEIQKVKVAKVPETIVEHMSTNAIQSILSQPDTSTDRGKRDAFLMLFLYKTGARVQELVDVRICDIQLSDTPRVLLHGKGAKSRAIPLRDDVVQHLKKYLALFHESESQYSDQYLFYSVRNQKKKRMTEQNVRS